jgi:hypothetical protein
MMAGCVPGNAPLLLSDISRPLRREILTNFGLDTKHIGKRRDEEAMCAIVCGSCDEADSLRRLYIARRGT